MPTFDPVDLERWSGGKWVLKPTGPLTGFSVDSRRLGQGQVFVALRTEKRDGHSFLGDALKAGASAAIVSMPQASLGLAQLVVDDPLKALQAIARGHRSRFRGKVVGVTGSAGKTSTKELLAALLGGSPSVHATRGNLNNYIGVALTLTELDPSVHTFAVVEAGISEPGEMAVLTRMIEPDLAIVTLVGAAHLEKLGDLDGVAREKSAIFSALRPDGVRIFPEDCLRYPPFSGYSSASIVVTPAKELPARVVKDRAAFTVHHDSATTRVDLRVGEHPVVSLSLTRVSDGMAQNLALAGVAALSAGAPAAELQRRLGSWKASPMRAQWSQWRGRTLYLDCYNANPTSMLDALRSFDQATRGEPRRTFVLGCMEELGAGADRYHREIGRALPLRGDDRAFIVGPYAGAVIAGAASVGLAGVTALGETTALASLIEGIPGPIFVKGSRRYELERAFSVSSQEVAHA